MEEQPPAPPSNFEGGARGGKSPHNHCVSRDSRLSNSLAGSSRGKTERREVGLLGRAEGQDQLTNLLSPSDGAEGVGN